MEPDIDKLVARVKESFYAQNFMGFIGAELEKVEPGSVEISLSFQSGLTQQHGLFHGGVVATIADNASGFAAFSLMSEDEQPLSIEFKVNLLSKAEGERLVAKGRVLKNGRRIKVCQTDVYCYRDGQEFQCAVALVSVIATKEKLNFNSSGS